MEPTRRSDEGSALVITLMVVVLVTVLTSTIMRVTVDDLGSSRRARDAGAALDAADAGLAQALAYLRRSGPQPLRCSPSCDSNPYGNAGAPATASLPGLAGQSYQVWIEPIKRWPEHKPAQYRIHSEGRVGDGTRSIRKVELDVYLNGLGLPMGMFGRTVTGGGTYQLARTSVFSTGCITNRQHIKFATGFDAAYGIPTGVHSSEVVTESHGNNVYCGDTGKTIHETSPCGPLVNPGGTRLYRFDHDSQGGPLESSPCSQVATDHASHYGSRDLDGDTVPDVVGSRLTSKDALFRLFDFKEEPLTPAQLDGLRTVAKSQVSHGDDHYWTTSAGFLTPSPTDHPHSVLYFDLLGGPDEGKTVNLSMLTDAWKRDANLSADSAGCLPRSLLIVVTGGNVMLNSNHRMAASIVLTSPSPYGRVLNNGTAQLIGTIFADTIDLVGTAELSLDGCAVANMNANLFEHQTKRYLEVDRY